MKYLAIEAPTIKDLNDQVNERILDGWKPIGGVSVSLSESEEYSWFVVSQAMVTNDVSTQDI